MLGGIGIGGIILIASMIMILAYIFFDDIIDLFD